MKLILFTKIFERCSFEEVGATARELGFDGLDLAIRAGQCVEPSNVKAVLPAAIEAWETLGLAVPLVTLEGHHTNPADKEIETIFATCGTLGIAQVKLGYWGCKPDEPYWDGVARVRKDLEGFQKLGEKHGICSLVHTHFGNLYGTNAAAAMHLLQGFDARYIGAYLDPAHQALCGEPVAMSLSMAGDYLKMIGVKNTRHLLPDDERQRWQPAWCALSEGLVDWPAAIDAIRAAGYTGPLSVHATYSDFRDKTGALRMVKTDLACLRTLVS